MADTNRIKTGSIVDLIFHLKWKSSDAIHTDGYQASKVNIWRDLLPPMLMDRLMHKEVGEHTRVKLSNGELVAPFTSRDLLEIKSSQFERRFRNDTIIQPRLGRFYPKGILKGISGIFRANVQPFRCVGRGLQPSFVR